MAELCQTCREVFKLQEVNLEEFFHSFRERPTKKEPQKGDLSPSMVDSNGRSASSTLGDNALLSPHKPVTKLETCGDSGGDGCAAIGGGGGGDVIGDGCGDDDVIDGNSDIIIGRSSPSVDEEPVSKRSKLSPSPSVSHDQDSCCPKVHCVACLGILDHTYVHHIANAITDHIKQVGVAGIETFCLSIHVPVSLPIRRSGMEMCASKYLNLGTGSSISENNYAKEEFRVQLKKELESSLFPLRCDYKSPFMINLKLDHQSAFRDCIGLKKLRPKLFPRPKKQRRFFKNKKPRQPETDFTSLPIQRAIEDITEEDLVKEGYFLSSIGASSCTHKIELQHSSVFVAGKYNKFSRSLPQTPWVIDGVRKVETSVQELISPRVISLFRASDVRFSSSGREDVDVLMLGNGRPFLLELTNPMDASVSSEELSAMESEINSTTDLIAVRELVRVSKESSVLLKEGEEEKKKTYMALVWTDQEISEESLRVLSESKDLVIKQTTPIRVLHRRTLAVRERVIYLMETEMIDAHHFRLKLVTQAGTYIKEFVHGDFGRTQPTVGTLMGCSADILSLNVLDVQLEWPPKSLV